MRERSVRGFYFREKSQARAFKSYTGKIPAVTGRPAGAFMTEGSGFLSYLAALALLSGLLLGTGVNFIAVFCGAALFLGGALLWPAGVKNILIIITAAIVPPLSVKMAAEKGRLLNALMLIAAFSFLGGIVVASAGWSAELYTKISQVRGIKLSFVLPFAVGAAVFLPEEIKTALGKEVKWSHLIAAAGFGAVFGVMIFRTANVSAHFVSGIEISLRNTLEKLFVFRPRFKEFLIGHPVLIAGLYAYFKKRGADVFSKILIVTGLMGSASVINSFMHMHTPVAASVIRSFYGWALGIPAGAAAVFLVRKWLPVK